jgi:CCR4-NOT transcriptional regulation complex NOT5 subunit
MENSEIQEKLKNGWIKSRLYIEVMATEKELTEQSLKEHVKKLKDVKDSIVLNERYEGVQEVKNLREGIKQAFSEVAQLEMLTRNIDTLLYIVIFYALSAVEVLEPKDLRMGIDQVQTIMNSVADLVHRFAASGLGGVVISTQQKPQA